MSALFRHRSLLLPAFVLVAQLLHAQGDALSCEQGYETALALYEDGRLFESVHQLDSLVPLCREDRDQQQRILLLKAVIEARNDSIKDMRRSLEQLFRNDRRFVLKPYDPLIVKLPVKEELYNTYEQLVGSRAVGPGQLRKDHGQWRAGVFAEGQHTLMQPGPGRTVFVNDEPPDYNGRIGWGVGAVAEYDVVPNLAVRLSAGYGVRSYEAVSPTVRYEEHLKLAPVRIGVKKMFWWRNSPWVPHLIAEGGWSHLLESTADIARSGDGLRFLPSKSIDRTEERTREQFWLGGGAGVGRKVNEVVVNLTIHYRAALSELTIADAAYTETELLTNYYWVDHTIWMDELAVELGVQYILRYHARNRIHP